MPAGNGTKKTFSWDKRWVIWVGRGGGVKECLYVFLTSPVPIYISLSAFERILPKDYTKYVEDSTRRCEDINLKLFSSDKNNIL